MARDNVARLIVEFILKRFLARCVSWAATRHCCWPDEQKRCYHNAIPQ